MTKQMLKIKILNMRVLFVAVHLGTVNVASLLAASVMTLKLKYQPKRGRSLEHVLVALSVLGGWPLGLWALHGFALRNSWKFMRKYYLAAAVNISLVSVFVAAKITFYFASRNQLVSESDVS
jgi:hypothetical protein